MWSDGITGVKPLTAFPRLVMRATMTPIAQNKLFSFSGKRIAEESCIDRPLVRGKQD